MRRWVGRNYFTALTLAYKLAWRLLALPKWEECLGLDRIEADKKAQRVVFHFDKLSQKDPITLERPKGNTQNDPVYRLALIMRALVAAGDSAHNSAVRDECQAWIEDFIPNIQQTLQKLAQETIAWRIQVDKGISPDQETPEPPDNLDTLAHRLEFVLSVMILSRNIRVVFYEWYNKPENMLTDLNEHSLERSPSNLTDILPVPPTGRMFGTYYSKDLEIGQDEKKNLPTLASLSLAIQTLDAGTSYISTNCLATLMGGVVRMSSPSQEPPGCHTPHNGTLLILLKEFSILQLKQKMQ